MTALLPDTIFWLWMPLGPFLTALAPSEAPLVSLAPLTALVRQYWTPQRNSLLKPLSKEMTGTPPPFSLGKQATVSWQYLAVLRLHRKSISACLDGFG